MEGFFPLNLSLFILVIGLLVFLTKKAVGALKSSRLKWVLMGYLIILLSALFVLTLLPQGDFLDMDTVSGKTLEEAQRAWEFYDWAAAGRPEEFPGDVVKLEAWEFDYAGDELKITGIEYDHD